MKRSSGAKPIDLIEISDDESPSKEPPQKVVKKEAEQFPSQAILGMHQNLVKMEKDYQDTCRIAEDTQKQVASPENLLDKKYDASDDTEKEELKKKLTEVSAELEDATRKNGEMIKIVNVNAEKYNERIDELTRKLSLLEETTQNKLQLQLQSQNKHIEELQKKIAETSTELEKEKNEAANREEQLKRLVKLEKDYQGVCRIANEYEMGMNEAKERVLVLENIIDTKPIIAPVVVDESDKRLIAELEAKLAETSTQLENVRSDAVRGEQKLQDRIVSLTRRLDAEQARLREEREKNREIRIELYRLRNVEGCAMQPSHDLALVPKKPLATVSPNLCEPCIPSEMEGSIPFVHALKQLHSRYHPSNNEWLWKCRNALFRESHQCATCNKGQLISATILSHFFSKGHINKMRKRNARVALATFEYWLAKLESIPKPAADTLPAPNVTVTPKVDDVKPLTTEKAVISAVATKVTVTDAAPEPVVAASEAREKRGIPSKTETILENPPSNPADESTEATEASRHISVDEEMNLRRQLRNAATIVTPKVEVDPTTETPATKVQVATVAPRFGEPKVEGSLRPVKQEEEDSNGNGNRCSLM